MSRSERCEETRARAAELALGIADGEDRARALEHAAACADCQRELERLAALADELLELGPEHEPPAGFELRVHRSLQPRAGRRRWIARTLPVVAAAVAAALITAGGLLLALRDDRELADHYRATLAQAHGSYFGAVRLHDATGLPAGVLFTYRGAPSWIIVTVAAPYRDSVARAELVTRGGRRLMVSGFRLSRGTWGGALPIDLSGLGAVHLFGGDGRSDLVAFLPQGR